MLTAYEYSCQRLQAGNKEKLASLGIHQTVKDLIFCRPPETRISVPRKRFIAPKGFRLRKSRRHSPSRRKDYTEGQQGSRMSSGNGQGSNANASSHDDPEYDFDNLEDRKSHLCVFLGTMACFNQQPRSVTTLVEQIQAKRPKVLAEDLVSHGMDVKLLQSFFGIEDDLEAHRLLRGLDEHRKRQLQDQQLPLRKTRQRARRHSSVTTSAPEDDHGGYPRISGEESKKLMALINEKGIILGSMQWNQISAEVSHLIIPLLKLA